MTSIKEILDKHKKLKSNSITLELALLRHFENLRKEMLKPKHKCEECENYETIIEYFYCPICGRKIG